MSPPRAVRRRTHAAALLLALSSTACVTVGGVGVTDVPPAAQSITAISKVHLRDGSTVLFPRGADIWNDSVVGHSKAGQRFAFGSTTPISVRAVPLDSVAAMERFDRELHQSSALTMLASGFLIVAGVLAAMIAASGGIGPTY